MYNWSVREDELKENKDKYDAWKLEQMVNFGLNGEKINKKELKKYWSQIKIDPARRRFLEILLNE